MAAIANDWLVPMSGEFKKPYYRKLYETVKSEYETKEVYPAPDDIFNAFAFTPLSKVKVVILGQDPYHEPGQAHGPVSYTHLEEHDCDPGPQYLWNGKPPAGKAPGNSCNRRLYLCVREYRRTGCPCAARKDPAGRIWRQGKGRVPGRT